MLTEEHRAINHRAVGDWLIGAGETDAMLVAGHLDRGGDPERAAGWYVSAAFQALSAGDLKGALARAERAEACGLSRELLGTVDSIRAEVHTWLGEPVTARECAVRAVSALPKGCVRWYRALVEVIMTSARLGDWAQMESSVDTLVEARADAAAIDSEIIAKAQSARVLYQVGSYRKGALLLGELEALDAYARGKPEVFAYVLLGRSYCMMFTKNDEALPELLETVVEHLERSGNLIEIESVRVAMGSLYIDLGAYEEALELLRAALASSERLGLQRLAATAKHCLGLALARLGVFEEARALEADAIAYFTQKKEARMAVAASSYMALILCLSGDMERAELVARSAVEEADTVKTVAPFAQSVLAKVLFAHGNAFEAIKHAELALGAITSLGGVEEGEELARLVHAEALKSIGRRAEAHAAIRTAVEQLLARSKRISDPAWRKRFLEDVPEHARTLELARSWLVVE
jgi:tetratricopeptide (TPR) repeat protein